MNYFKAYDVSLATAAKLGSYTKEHNAMYDVAVTFSSNSWIIRTYLETMTSQKVLIDPLYQAKFQEAMEAAGFSIEYINALHRRTIFVDVTVDSVIVNKQAIEYTFSNIQDFVTFLQSVDAEV